MICEESKRGSLAVVKLQVQSCIAMSVRVMKSMIETERKGMGLLAKLQLGRRTVIGNFSGMLM